MSPRHCLYLWPSPLAKKGVPPNAHPHPHRDNDLHHQVHVSNRLHPGRGALSQL
eukprot:CAMPEP_0170645736 /NCGR_PEP_ID=MMETSP0224-20130122/43257_1 /TAXON_ID=285029 /ORGANISM="Togula jolla, Strain CCCM 725" /LENGTH=53 /DNA_ID=CAMNT_0010977009 /DNA_START=235 /DNA_END=396 /DNA_ORIENTATION=+